MRWMEHQQKTRSGEIQLEMHVKAGDWLQCMARTPHQDKRRITMQVLVSKKCNSIGCQIKINSRKKCQHGAVDKVAVDQGKVTLSVTFY